MKRFWTLLLVTVVSVDVWSQTIVNIYEAASAVKDKGLASMPRGHYSATCLYSSIAELYLAEKNPEDLREVEEIIADIASGKITISSSNIISYQIGGQVAE